MHRRRATGATTSSPRGWQAAQREFAAAAAGKGSAGITAAYDHYDGALAGLFPACHDGEAALGQGAPPASASEMGAIDMTGHLEGKTSIKNHSGIYLTASSGKFWKSISPLVGGKTWP